LPSPFTATGDLPLKKLLAPFGIRLEWEKAKVPSLGVKTASEGNDLKLATVFDGSAAQAAGLSAGDVLVAINGLRVTAASLEKQLARRQPGDTITRTRLPPRRVDGIQAYPWPTAVRHGQAACRETRQCPAPRLARRLSLLGPIRIRRVHEMPVLMT